MLLCTKPVMSLLKDVLKSLCNNTKSAHACKHVRIHMGHVNWACIAEAAMHAGILLLSVSPAEPQSFIYQ